MDDYSISPKNIEKKIISLKKDKKKVKAIIVTDYGGQPAKWKEINRIKKNTKSKLFLIIVTRMELNILIKNHMPRNMQILYL